MIQETDISDEFEDWVRPAAPVEAQVIELSTIDQAVVRCWSSYVLCFPLDASENHFEIFQCLSNGLSWTLAQFPFLVSQLSVKNQQTSSLQLVIGPAAGVSFRYRDLSRNIHGKHYTYDDLRRSNFAPSLIEDANLGIAPSPQTYPAEGSPVFLAQATFLKGGLLLFFAHSHQVTDVSGTDSIMKIWSENVTQAALGKPQLISHELRDASMYGDRMRLTYDEPIHDPEFPTSAWATAKVENPLPAALPIPAAEITIKQQPICVPKEINPSLIWYMSPENLAKLKDLAYPKCGNGAYISTLDAVNALFWRQITKARQLHKTDIDHTTLYFVCDVRSRLLPPIRRDSACNATMKLFSMQQSKNMIETDLPSAIRQAASGIRQSINDLSPSKYSKWIGFLQSAPSFACLQPKEQLQDGPDVVATDHSKVAAYQNLWGPLGHSERIRNPWWSRSNPKPYSQITLMPRLPDGGLEVLTNLDDDINECLLEDMELARFATLRCL